MAQTVVGIFDNASEAQQAVEHLISNGFSRSNVDISAATGSGASGSDALIPDRHTNTSGTRTEEVVDDTKDVGDSIGNFFSSLFGSDDDDNTRKYSTVGSKSTIVTVHAQSDDEAERAASILDDNGAVDVDERAAQYGYTSTGMTDTTRPMTTNTDDQQTIKVIQENLEVGKREVETGGVRVRSRIVSRPVEESVRLREERVSVQRTPVNRPATDADLNAFQEGQIELTERAEVPVASKTANVVEEISVGKTVSEREEVVRDTVRNTEVDVENIGTAGQNVRTEREDLGLDTSTDDDLTYSTK